MSSSSTSRRTEDALKVLLGLGLPLLLVASNARFIGDFTIDDAFISFRYARNLTRGLGLVYNQGEVVEGYTNFFWTVLMAGAIKLGIDPVIAAKCLGGAAVFGIMTLFYAMGGGAFCIANWLLATAFSFQAHALLGLEGGLFTFLMLLGAYLLAKPGKSLWPAAAFALAALTRPEAPAYFLIALVLLAREGRWRRLALFAAIVGAHVAWRHAFYGTWLPNTLAAKTGNITTQFYSGVAYVRAYLLEAGPLLVLFLFGAAYAWVERDRRALALVALALFNVAYVLVVGADWMFGWRYLMPFEIFAFAVADFGGRRLLEADHLAIKGGATAVLLVGLLQRYDGEDKTKELVASQQELWHKHARATGRWLAAHGAPGAVSLGDIGEVGWLTDWPIFDVLGLVTKEVAQLPGGYGHKADNPEFIEAFFQAAPRWFVMISDRPDCLHSPFTVMRVQSEDPRFREAYDFVHSVRLSDTSAWCLYERKNFALEMGKKAMFDFEDAGLTGWTRYGNAFEGGVARGAQGPQQRVIGVKGAGFLNSFHPSYGDKATGIAQSPQFKIEQSHLALRVGGGSGFDTRVELLVDGVAQRAAFGDDSEDLARVVWAVAAYMGHDGVIRVVDASEAGWGHILVDQIESFDDAGVLSR
jgi:hypothetical protein